jgi:hypothetical protein
MLNAGKTTLLQSHNQLSHLLAKAIGRKTSSRERKGDSEAIGSEESRLLVIKTLLASNNGFSPVPWYLLQPRPTCNKQQSLYMHAN